MANHEDLKVFVKFYDLTLWLHQKVVKFPRNLRFTLGQRIENTAFETLELIVVANSTFDRKHRLKVQREIRLRLEVLRILIRIAKDLELIAHRSYKFVSEGILEVGRMLGGWVKDTKNKMPPRSKDLLLSGGGGEAVRCAALIRGGNWNNVARAGVFSLNLNNSPSNSNNNIGLRAARSLSRPKLAFYGRSASPERLKERLLRVSLPVAPNRASRKQNRLGPLVLWEEWNAL